MQSRVATNSPLTANAAPRFSGALQAHVDATASAWRFVSDASEWMTEEGVEVEEASTRSVDAAEAVGTMQRIVKKHSASASVLRRCE